MLDAKSKLSRLVDAVESGAEKEIVIARRQRSDRRIVFPPQGVRILLDTHIAVWAIADPRLTSGARTLIADADNIILVGAASIREIAIKHALARGGF